MRVRRASLSLAERQRRAEPLLGHVLASPAWSAGPRTLLVYAATVGEPPLAGLVAQARAAGVRVALPRVEGADLVLHAWPEGGELSRGAFGIGEPARAWDVVSPADVDLVMVPGLAFDPAGHRLGQGGGHYDRLLARLRPDAWRVGAGWAFQVVPQLPVEAHDQRVHAVVTEEGWTACVQPPPTERAQATVRAKASSPSTSGA
ncbi:MAG: hypothetical protein RLZZ299_1981 [Pseudomonadota bacterium]